MRYDNGAKVEIGDQVVYTGGPREDWDRGEVVDVVGDTLTIAWESSGDTTEQSGDAAVRGLVAYTTPRAAREAYHAAISEHEARWWGGSQDRGALLRDLEARAVSARVRQLTMPGAELRLTGDEVERLGEETIHWMGFRLGLAHEAAEDGGAVLSSRA